MTTASSEGLQGGATSRLGLCLVALVGTHVLATHPFWQPASMGIEIDPSWRAGLHHAWVQGWRHGSDIVFNHGPYGFSTIRVFHPETFVLALTLNLLGTAVGFAALCRIVFNATGSLVLAAVACLVFFDSAELALDAGYIVLTALPLFLLASLPSAQAPLPKIDAGLLHALAILLAWIALTKLTFALACLVSLTACAAFLMSSGWGRPWFAGTLAAGGLVLWHASGHGTEDAAAYVGGALEVIAGYTEAMSRPLAVEEIVWLAAGSAVVAAAISGLLFALHGRHAVAPALGMSAIVFVLFKTSVVRQDAEHLPILLVGLTSLSVPALALGLGLRRRTGSLLPLAGVIAAIALVLACGAFALKPREGMMAAYPSAWLALQRSLPARWARPLRALTDFDSLTGDWERSREGIRRQVPLPSLAGGVDVYPNYVSIALAHGLDYRPRPVFQSYTAYTGPLLDRNRTHLAGEDAADHLLFTVFAIDGRLPSLEDSLSWPTLMTRYRVVDRSAPFEILRRDEGGRSFEFGPAVQVTSAFGRPLSVPPVEPGRGVWAEIDVRPTWRGRALAALFRPPRIWMELRTRDGRVARHRLIPAIARAGFLLSPLVVDNAGFRQLASATNDSLWRTGAVTGLRLLVGAEPGRRSAYHPEVEIRFQELRWDPMPLAHASGPDGLGASRP